MRVYGRCGEQAEDAFDACWKCEASLQSPLNTTFQQEVDAPSESRRDSDTTGLDASDWADLVLIVGQVCALAGCLTAFVIGLVSLFDGHIVGMVACPLAFANQLALSIVFARVRHMHPLRDYGTRDSTPDT